MNDLRLVWIQTERKETTMIRENPIISSPNKYSFLRVRVDAKEKRRYEHFEIEAQVSGLVSWLTRLKFY